MDTRGHPAVQVRPHKSAYRTDSQADSASSILVTRSKAKTLGQEVASSAGLTVTGQL
jgi:hypothetical protein